MIAIHRTHIILFVHDQQVSTVFYERLLDCEAHLKVPGMTEFVINDALVLGLMPNSSIARILDDRTPHPEEGTGIPRCELYLYVDSPDHLLKRGIECGGRLISENQERNWGDTAGYISDPDGHIIAFAKKKINT